MKNLKLFTFLMIALVAFVSLGNTKCDKKNQPPQGTPSVPPSGIPISKFCGAFTDFQLTPNGAKVSSCGAMIPEDYLTVVDDACSSHIEAMRIYYPEWTQGLDASSCDVLLLEPDGTLTTILDYPRPYLTVAGITTAGTVMFGAERAIIVMPHYAQIEWQNRHFQFYGLYHEREHQAGFLNRNDPPVEDWRNWLGEADTHPQHPYIESTLPGYARQTTSLAARNSGDDLKDLKPINLTSEQEQLLFGWLDDQKAKYDLKKTAK